MQTLRNLSHAATLAALTAVTLVAQEPPAPNPQVLRIAKAAGSWQGEGTWRETADSEPSPWTATMRVEPILGGHFVREDMRISVGMPTPIAYTTIYGWDADRERVYAVSFSNLPVAPMRMEVHWAGPKTMLAIGTGMAEGTPMVGRAMWRMNGAAIEYRHEAGKGDAAWFTEIEGAFQKTEEKLDMGDVDSFMSMPVSPQMAKLSRLLGRWQLQGDMRMPGMPEAMPVRGTETIQSMFGGHLVAGVAKSDPMPDGSVWEGLSFFAWDADTSRYRLFMCDNSGDGSFVPTWWQGEDALVSIDARMMMGQPAVNRTVTRFDDGGMTGFESWMIAGTDEPMQSFRATYRRVDGG